MTQVISKVYIEMRYFPFQKRKLPLLILQYKNNISYEYDYYLEANFTSFVGYILNKARNEDKD